MTSPDKASTCRKSVEFVENAKRVAAGQHAAACILKDTCAFVGPDETVCDARLQITERGTVGVYEGVCTSDKMGFDSFLDNLRRLTDPDA
jgi:hypothetical protein